MDVFSLNYANLSSKNTNKISMQYVFFSWSRTVLTFYLTIRIKS